jgi:glycosyltransferase involved in cell wall biosynthesis
MGTEETGLGEILHPQLPEFISHYRFFFNPIRYTSFGLAVCEAMMIGLPVVGLATTEMPAVFTNGLNGVVHTNVDYLIAEMQRMIIDKKRADVMGKEGQRTARSRFNINRFIKDWEELFTTVIKSNTHEKTDSLYQ